MLSRTDSVFFDLGKNTPEDFLNLSSDTLHDFLNIYLQKKEKKLVRIFRFNKDFKQTATVSDVEITRLNSYSVFENETYYFKNQVYSIRTISDSTGKQFYLNKYQLKSDSVNFEYLQSWQFPFERRNINNAHIIFANKSFVLLYVYVNQGQKQGQWLLKINAETGLLIKGTKIGEKGEKNFYAYGNSAYDSTLKSTYIIGQKYLETEISQIENKHNLAGKPNLTIFLAQIDSFGDVILKKEFKIPIIEAKGIVNKVPVYYLLRIDKFSKTKEGNFNVSIDVFKGSNKQLCLTYANSILLKINDEAGELSMEKNMVNTNPLLEKYYLNNDALNMNGKLCVDSLINFEKLYYKSISFPVKIKFKTDESGNFLWLLSKSESKNNNENFSLLSPVKKIYQINKISDIPKNQNPVLINFSEKNYIISKQISDDKLLIQLYNW